HTQRVHTDVTAPATPEAERWAGWGTALKPAIEPIILARKPLVGTVAQNVLAHGVGGLNIDASRVATDDGKPAYAYRNGPGGNTFSVGEGPDGTRTEPTVGSPAGRWPANVLLDPEAAAAMDEQSGGLKTGGPKASRNSTGGVTGWGSGAYSKLDEGGAAARGLHGIKTEQAPPAVAGRWPANVLLDPEAAEAMDQQSGWSKSPDVGSVTNTKARHSGSMAGAFKHPKPMQNGHGDSGGASRFFPVFKYQAKAPKKERPVIEREDGTKVQHNTVK